MTDCAGVEGSLALSCVRALSAATLFRARTWQRDLDRLGVSCSFALVHDLGMLLSTPHAELLVGPRREAVAQVSRVPGASDLLDAYHALVREIAETVTARRSSVLRLPDALVSVLLARVLERTSATMTRRRPYTVELSAEAALLERADLELVPLWGAVDRRFDLESLAAFVAERLVLLTAIDAQNLDTLRLLSRFGESSTDLVDLRWAIDGAASADVAALSLELLREPAGRSLRGVSSHGDAGYAGVGQRGSLDALLPTELAWDNDELRRRVLEDEVLYYVRDSTDEAVTRVHHVLIDASASMRGGRATFARAVALARARKLAASGDRVDLRFFDARLYDAVPCRQRQVPTAFLLAFRGERGRNPSRVLELLTMEIAAARRRARTEHVVHLFTHGALHITREVVRALSEVARLAVVFVAPHGDVRVTYLDLLHAHWVVTEDQIGESAARADVGRAIASS